MRTIDVGPATESPPSCARSTSRRTLLARITRVSAVATPVALLMLGPATASAQERWRDRGDSPDGRDGRGFLPRQDIAQQQQQQDGGVRRDAGFLTLVTVGSVNGGPGGSDLSANNPGGDALAAGSLGINDADHKIFVDIRGAQANASYDVQFVRLNDHGREDLGSITTGDRGEFSGPAPNALGGNQRVGTFMLSRNGQDEYVTAFA